MISTSSCFELGQVCAVQQGAVRPLCKATTALPPPVSPEAALHPLPTHPLNYSPPPNPQPRTHPHRPPGSQPPPLLLRPTLSDWRSCVQPIPIQLANPAPAGVSASAGEALVTLQPLLTGQWIWAVAALGYALSHCSRCLLPDLPLAELLVALRLWNPTWHAAAVAAERHRRLQCLGCSSSRTNLARQDQLSRVSSAQLRQVLTCCLLLGTAGVCMVTQHLAAVCLGGAR